MKQWLMSPSKIPNAPSWRFVFLFGAAWNAVVARCLWAVVLCIVIAALLPALDRLDRALFRSNP